MIMVLVMFGPIVVNGESSSHSVDGSGCECNDFYGDPDLCGVVDGMVIVMTVKQVDCGCFPRVLW